MFVLSLSIRTLSKPAQNTISNSSTSVTTAISCDSGYHLYCDQLQSKSAHMGVPSFPLVALETSTRIYWIKFRTIRLCTNTLSGHPQPSAPLDSERTALVCWVLHPHLAKRMVSLVGHSRPWLQGHKSLLPLPKSSNLHTLLHHWWAYAVYAHFKCI
jgi:hypothetical protein